MLFIILADKQININNININININSNYLVKWGLYQDTRALTETPKVTIHQINLKKPDFIID